MDFIDNHAVAIKEYCRPAHEVGASQPLDP
jgi:hypothetical protein